MSTSPDFSKCGVVEGVLTYVKCLGIVFSALYLHSLLIYFGRKRACMIMMCSRASGAFSLSVLSNFAQSILNLIFSII